MEIFIILGLILLNGFFSLAEISLISARKVRLESQAHKGDARAKKALKLVNKPDIFLSTVQIGITLVGILTGIFSGDNIKYTLSEWLARVPLLQPYSNTLATLILVILITYFSLVLGELVPKRIGMNNPEATAKWVTPFMNVLNKIAKPFIWILNKSSDGMIHLLHIKSAKNEMSEEEIKAIIHEGAEQGAIEMQEQQIISRVFSLGDRSITSMMTHRSDLVSVDENRTVGFIKRHCELHSVYPVCEKDLDHFKGVVFIKDLLVADDATLVKDITVPAMFVPENITAYHLLEKFKKSKIHYAMIVDEYGSLVGMITLHDILEAIVGDMAEEDDEELEIIQREDGTYLVDAQIPFYEFLSYFDIESWMEEEESDEFDTLAGFILHHLEHIPKAGEKLEWHKFIFEILDMDGHRIDKVLVTKPEILPQDESGDA